MRRERRSVVAVEWVGPYALLRLSRGGIDPGAPGQFFMLEAPGRVLPRPMSLCFAPPGELAFLIDPIGPGTRALSTLEAGDRIELLILPAGEYSCDTTVVDLEVRLGDGSAIGRGKDLIHAGNDLLEVELLESGRSLLIPFVQAIVPRVELAEGWIGITPPPGLLELADDTGTREAEEEG